MAAKPKHPLVWIDCEMTGLDKENDTILSICCLITDGSLNLVDDKGYDAVIHHERSALDNMNEWCIRTHGESGLTAACLQSTTTPEEAADGLLEYINRYIPENSTGLLAGSSVHHDKEFLSKGPYKKIMQRLSHRILDVSSIKEAASRWSDPKILQARPVKKCLHEARADILESIEEARFYQKAIFQPAAMASQNPTDQKKSE